MDYNTLYPLATRYLAGVRSAPHEPHESAAVLDKILHHRLDSSEGMSPHDVGFLLTTVLNPALGMHREKILASSTALRRRTYGNHVATMVPIEIGSYCTSNCTFCGWRRDNTAMLRLRVNRGALIAQVRELAALGFSHFELSGGDDLLFLQKELYPTVRAVKSVIEEVVPEGRLSICLTPLMADHYQELSALGLDTVLTWQETYHRATYERLITKGPKANGIDLDFRLLRGGDGFLSRASSQERAVKAGLQVGIGVMLGLAPDPEADVLATILHGQYLLGLYEGNAVPLIIGMPTWNPITTIETDQRGTWHRPFDPAEVFEIIAAIYFLAFPDYKAWVFPNCRVAMATQVRSIVTAGVFSSTMVRVGPGAYLANMSDCTSLSDAFESSSTALEALTRSKVLQGEQFQHHFHDHSDYVNAFQAAGLEVVSDSALLNAASRRR